MTKTLWIICGVLVLAAGLVLASNFHLSVGKMVSGAKTEIPEIGNDLAKPPVLNSNAKDPQVNAASVILMDVDSFKILYEKTPDRKVPIASTTKIMTAMVLLDDYPDKLNDTVTITREMINVEGSDIQLRVGEKIKMSDLLKGLLIMSGNDAAYSIADYLGGRKQFVKKMNEKASFLGLGGTSYKDPAGLNDDGYSTAQDLAFLGAYAMRHRQFAEIVKIPTAMITSTDGKLIHELKNSNRMILPEEQLYFPAAVGIKTGFTYAAGHCLVSEAVNNKHRILAVVLNTNENTLTASAKESKKLLEWGFNNWSW